MIEYNPAFTVILKQSFKNQGPNSMFVFMTHFIVFF